MNDEDREMLISLLLDAQSGVVTNDLGYTKRALEHALRVVARNERAIAKELEKE